MHATWLRISLGLLLLSLTAAAAAPGAEGVTIRKAEAGQLALTDKDKPLYTIAAKTYTAEVYRTGRVRIMAGATVLMDGLVLEAGREVKPLGRITRGEGDRIVLQEGKVVQDSAPTAAVGEPTDEPMGKDAKLPDLPGVAVNFLPDRVEIAPAGQAAKKPADDKSNLAVSGLFGDDVLAVRNLRSGIEDALPARYLCGRHIFSFYGWIGHYWPEIALTAGDGTRMEIRGITGISHYALGKRDPYTNEALAGKRGFWSLREVGKDNLVTILIQPAGEKATLGPAPYTTVRADKPRSMFYDTEKVIYHMDFAEQFPAAGKWKLTWTLEDHRQRPAGGGSMELTLAGDKQPPVDVDITPKEPGSTMGFFRARLVLSRVDAPAAKRTHEFNFGRIRPECPDLRELDGKADEEMLWANILGMRGIRLNPTWADNRRQFGRADGSIDWDAWRKQYEPFIGLAKRGTVKGLFSFTGADVSKDLAKWFEKEYPDEKVRKEKIAEARKQYLTEYAREAGKLGVTAWEPINEPDLGMPQQRYIDDFLKVQYPAVKAGNPNANFLGGSICGLEKHGWVRKLYELGAQEWFDGTSMHPYTGLGFQEAYRAELDQWWQILRDYKDTAGGIWMTESAWHRGWGYNDYVYDKFNAFRQSEARNAVLMHLNAEAMAVPRDRIYVFYLVEHGYNDFFLLWREAPTSAAISIQTMNECLRDAKFVEELPLPTPGHYFQIYRDDKRTVAAAFTAGEDAELDLATDAKGGVTVTDLMGNRRTVQPEGGRLKLTIGGDPTYLAVAAGEFIRPVLDALRVQPNLASPTLGATASASSVAKPKGKPVLPPSAAICGDWTCYSGSMAWTGARRGWDEDDANRTFPDWFEVRLPAATPVARVRVVHDYGAWERLLRDFDVQVQAAGGDWKTVAEVRANHYGFVHDLRFEPVTTDRVRILIRDVNSCFFENMQWIPKLSSLRAMEVYGPAAGAAKAFFVQDIPRRHIAPAGGKVELTFAVRNTTDKPLTGEVRLKLPAGVTAEGAAAKPLTVPAGGTATCSFTVALADTAPEGLHTVLAGFYDGTAMIAADYATRVVCCKKK